MKIHLRHLSLACSLALVVAGCSDRTDPIRFTPTDTSGDTSDPGITVSGSVTAPGGTVAQLENNLSIAHLVFNFVIRSSYADILGLIPVSNGTAELIRIDDDGNQAGDVLASAPLSIDGSYSLELPSGVALAADLVVRVSGGSVSMGAMVVDQEVDIDPLSQYVLDKFVDDENLVLADLPVNQVVALQGRVREFDLTAEADLSAMLARLEVDLGELVETEIETIKSTPDDGTVASAAAGTWNTIELGLELHDSEDNTFGTFNTGIFSSTVTIAVDDSNPTELDISETSILLDSFTNLSFNDSGVWNIFNEVVGGTTGEGELFSGEVASNGTVTVAIPFEEELQTGDCPQVGWRFPPSNLVLENTGNGNALINVNAEASVRYDTVDTTGDQCPNAIDPESKDGDEVSVEMLLVLKAGSSMSEADLNGDYGFVTLFSEQQAANNTIIMISTVGQGTFDGAGNVSVPANGLDELGFGRSMGSTPGTANLFNEASSEGPINTSYSVGPNGMMTLTTGTNLEGWVNDDGSVFGLLDIYDDEGNPVSTVSQEIMIGVKLPSSPPSLGDAVYRLHPMLFGAGDNGFMEITTLSRNNSLTFSSTGDSATLTGRVRGYEISSETGDISSFAEDDSFTLNVNPVGTHGAISASFTETGSETAIKGFVSEDGSVMVLRIYDTGTNDRLVGIILAVKQ